VNFLFLKTDLSFLQVEDSFGSGAGSLRYGQDSKSLTLELIRSGLE
jgi:hypothetical protein